MLLRRSKRLVLLADGELPVDVPVELAIGHEISREELKEVLPRLYLANPDYLKLLARRTKHKKRRVIRRRWVIPILSELSTIEKLFAVTIAGVLILALGAFVVSGGWGGWIVNLLSLVVFSAVFIVPIALGCLGMVALLRLRSGLGFGSHKSLKLDPDARLFLGQVTSAAPQDAQGGDRSFEWEFTDPDGKLCGGRQDVLETRMVPGVGRPVIVKYKEAATYDLL